MIMDLSWWIRILLSSEQKALLHVFSLETLKTDHIALPADADYKVCKK